MSRVTSIGFMIILLVAVVGAVPDEKPKPQKRIAPVRHLMLGIAQPSYEALRKAQGKVPAAHREREKLMIQVSLLNELGFSLAAFITISFMTQRARLTRP